MLAAWTARSRPEDRAGLPTASEHPAIPYSIAGCRQQSTTRHSQIENPVSPGTASPRSSSIGESQSSLKLAHHIVQSVHIQHRVAHGLRDFLAMVKKRAAVHRLHVHH